MVKISGRFGEGSGQSASGRPRRRLLGYAAALLATLLWGSSFVGTKLLLADLTPLTLQIVRFALAALAYLALLVLVSRGVPALPRRARVRLVLVAVFGPALNSLGVVFAVNLLGAGTSSLVIMLVPVLTGLLAVLAGQERFGIGKVIGLAVALAGFAIVVLPGGPERSFAGAGLAGLLLLFGGALGFAVYNVYARPLFAFYSPLEVSAYLGLLAPLSLLAFVFYGPLWSDPWTGSGQALGALFELSAAGWLLLAYLGLPGSAGAFLCWYWALRALGATRVALFSYLIPIWGLSGAALVLQERISPWLPVGVALVVAGIVIANRGARERE